MHETQHTIAMWMDAMFGGSCSHCTIAARAVTALATLFVTLTDLGNEACVRRYAAETVISLLWLAERRGFNLATEVQHNMAVNRRTSHSNDFLTALNKEP